MFIMIFLRKIFIDKFIFFDYSKLKLVLMILFGRIIVGIFSNTEDVFLNIKS